MTTDNEHEALVCQSYAFGLKTSAGKALSRYEPLNTATSPWPFLRSERTGVGPPWLRCKSGLKERCTLLWLPVMFYFAGSRPEDEQIRPERAPNSEILE